MNIEEAKVAFGEIGWHVANMHLHLARAADELNASHNWHRPVEKVRSIPVSGDHLRQYKHELDDIPERVFATGVRSCNTEGGL